MPDNALEDTPWMNTLCRQSKIFGIPFRILTADHANKIFDHGNHPNMPKGQVSIEKKYAAYLEKHFRHLNFFRASLVELFVIATVMTSQRPYSNTLYSPEDVSKYLASGRTTAIDPIGIVVHPPALHHTGHYFLSAFTGAPDKILQSMPSAKEDWFLMQTSHELGHAAGADEVMADICGALAYVALKGSHDFLRHWRTARFYKWLFNQEPDDFMCANAVGIVHENIINNRMPPIDITSQDALVIAANIKNKAKEAIADISPTTLADIRRQILSELEKTGFDPLFDLIPCPARNSTTYSSFDATKPFVR
ncbi:MAG: hypothetical protein P4M13_06830 [Alphaproteobacteria bacterium]|nr:hypothetical protein [Alphaproteobacteria bacterium]